MLIGETTPWTGTPTTTLNATAFTAATVVSVGVNFPVKTVLPDAAGVQRHFATNGAAVDVATASQPFTTAPAAEN